MRKISENGVKSETVAHPTFKPNGNKVALAPKHQLPAHLLKMLEDWHTENPGYPPGAAGATLASAENGYTFQIITRDMRIFPPLEEISIIKPSRYNVYYLPIMDGQEKGMLIKFVPWGNRRTFLKQWLGDYKFKAEPVAVRLRSLDGSFGELPTEEIWEEATKRKLPCELKHEEGEGTTPRHSITRKRTSEEDDEDAMTERLSVSSSGSDIYPDANVTSRRRENSTSRDPVSRHRRPSRHPRRSSSALRNVNSNGDSVDEDADNHSAQPAGLSNGGLPVFSRSVSHAGFVSGSAHNTQNPITTRKSLSNLNSQIIPQTSPLINDSTAAASDSGVDLSTPSHFVKDSSILSSITPTPSSSSSVVIIKFKFVVPRTKMVRDVRVEENEENAENLFSQAKDFFRRYDRLVGTPVLECVVEGEPECRCIYNAKELGYFIEELRERRGVVKVTVTQSS